MQGMLRVVDPWPLQSDSRQTIGGKIDPIRPFSNISTRRHLVPLALIDLTSAHELVPPQRLDVAARLSGPCHLDCLRDVDLPPINIVSRKSGQPATDSDACW